ncbi:MAG: 16S rRNA (uracil(1498)-N(3))-methyltransferase [Bacteroidota bacterium]|nr:16S rRNA (uracil(1498)-N(3))-methyltransferase [Bacteroidota bacterium]
MQLFYSPTLNQDVETYIFDKEESKHIVKVLRKKEEDIIHITNGLGLLCQAEIVYANEKKCEVRILNRTHFSKHNYHLHLMVAPTKTNERFEWFVEKATEMGIDEITPIITEHSERKEVKIERFEKIVLSAMKQSLQYFLPKINQPIKFKQLMQQDIEGDRYLAHCEEVEKQQLANQDLRAKKITILIGPEGDFSSEEISTALSKGYKPIALGNTRLRTETAAVYSVCVVASQNENPKF